MERKLLTQAQIDEIRRLRLEGWTNKKLAEKFGVNSRTITRHTLDIVKRREPRLGRKTHEMIKNLAARGFSKRKISNITGANYNTVCEILKANPLPSTEANIMGYISKLEDGLRIIEGANGLYIIAEGDLVIEVGTYKPIEIESLSDFWFGHIPRVAHLFKLNLESLQYNIWTSLDLDEDFDVV